MLWLRKRWTVSLQGDKNIYRLGTVKRWARCLEEFYSQSWERILEIMYSSTEENISIQRQEKVPSRANINEGKSEKQKHF